VRGGLANRATAEGLFSLPARRRFSQPVTRYLHDKTVIAAVAMLAMTTMTANAQSSQSPDFSRHGSSAVALQELFADWDRIGFSPPGKPGQFRVYGRGGYVTSGPGYNTMVTLMRIAAADSRAGRDQEALEKIAKVRSLLTH
jgi:hypothetical protein